MIDLTLTGPADVLSSYWDEHSGQFSLVTQDMRLFGDSTLTIRHPDNDDLLLAVIRALGNRYRGMRVSLSQQEVPL
jgi:hypothetical protein